MTGWMESLGARRFALSQEPANADLTSRGGNRGKEVRKEVCECLIEVRRVVMVWQTSKSRFVYCLEPYIAAMISKGKAWSCGHGSVLLQRAGEMGGGARNGRAWERGSDASSDFLAGGSTTAERPGWLLWWHWSLEGIGGIGARVPGWCNWCVDRWKEARVCELSERRAKSHLNLSPAGEGLRPGFNFGAMRSALIDHIAHACCCSRLPPPSTTLLIIITVLLRLRPPPPSKKAFCRQPKQQEKRPFREQEQERALARTEQQQQYHAYQNMAG